jgi:hypothetical protein
MTATIGLATLDEVLAYRHPGTVRRYREEYRATPGEAGVVFRGTLKFLHLSARAAGGGFGCAITAEIERLDLMWHAFLLFTRDYAAFCDRHSGVFLDHIPAEADEQDGAVADEAGVRASVERQFRFVYDVLGEETLVAWYDDCRSAA